MKKPELLVTPHDLTEIEALIVAGADAFIIGDARFSLRIPGNFDLDALQKAIKLIKTHHKKVYVAINAVMSNEWVENLREYLLEIKDLEIDALRFSDPGAYLVAKELVPDIALQWSSETMGTNYFTANYWLERGVNRVVLAPEIMKDAILETKEQAIGEIEILVHGAINMFQSRRHLIENYFTFQESIGTNIGSIQPGYSLFDQERQLYYPIFEDQQGTHIFNGTDVCMVDDLSEFIDRGIDSVRIEGILKSSDYLINVTKAYRMAIDLCYEDRLKYQQISRALYKKLEEIQPENRKLDRGFFYKPSIYKNKEK